MNINTSNVIETIKQDIQKKIDMEQKRLNDINNSLTSVEQFLLDNGHVEIKENEDILAEVMQTIRKLKKQTTINKSDIENINKSISALKSINNHIDDNILMSLDIKIKEIQEEIDKTSDKLGSVNEFLGILLHLQMVCPICGGSGSVSAQVQGNDQEKRFVGNKGQGASNISCSYCEGVGVLSIGKILANEELLEVEFKSNTSDVKTAPNGSQSSASMLNKNSGDNYISNKYVINRQ